MVSIILFSTFLLIADTYLEKSDYFAKDVTKYLHITVAILFSFDIWLKSITYGFFLDRRSFMRDNWNIMNFILSLAYVVDVIFDDDADSFMIQVLFPNFFKFYQKVIVSEVTQVSSAVDSHQTAN